MVRNKSNGYGFCCFRDAHLKVLAQLFMEIKRKSKNQK